MAPKNNLITRISVVYRIYFLYFEPVAALGGTYLCLFDPMLFLRGTVPSPAFNTAFPIPITPILQLLLTNIGSLYVLFAINEALVLRVSRERRVWSTILASMLAADCGHIYAAYTAAPDRIFQCLAWNSEEWINYGTLILGMVLRILFLMGIGTN